MKMRIGTRLMLGALFGVLAVVFVVSLAAYHIARRGLEGQITAHLVSVAQSRAAHVQTFLHEHKEIARLAATSRVMRADLRKLEEGGATRAAAVESLNRQLASLLDPADHIYDFFLLDRRGVVVASTSPENIGQDNSGNAYFVGARKGAFIKDAYLSATTGRQTHAVSAPLFDRESGELLSVLVARIGLVELSAIMTDRTGLGETGETYLVNKYGFMISPSRFRKDTFLKLKVDTENARKCLADQRAMRRGALAEGHEHAAEEFIDYRGERVLGVHAHVPEMEWGLLAEINADEAFAPITRLKKTVMAFAVLFAVAVLVAVYFFARRISGPIHELHVGSERIGAGELDYRLNIKTGDEIEQLADEFNRMAAKLSESYASLEQKVAERTAALRESEEQLRITLASIGDGVVAVDTDRRVTQFNKVAEELTGWTFKEARGQPLDEVFRIINEETRIPAEDPVARVLATGRIEGLANHTVLVGKDGTERAIADSAAPILGTDDQVVGVVLVFRDVTEERQRQKEKEQLLRDLGQLKQQMEFILGATNTGIDIIDSGFNVRYVDPEWQKVYGDPSGRKCHEYFMDRDDVCPGCGVVKALQTKETAVTEEVLVKENDRPIQVTTMPFQGENGEWLVAEVNVDITDRKEAEREVAEARKAAEAANEAKSLFLANMSHEIRTPLTAILGYADLMADSGQPEAERQDALATIRRNGEHLLSLINDILDLSKIEAGKLELVPGRCSLPTVAADVISLMRVRAEEGGISLSAEYAGPLPETILADAVRVRQVLVNLVGNATKFTIKGGVRTVAAFLPDGLGGAPAVRVEVIDTGVGIAPDDLKRLGRPFTQVDPSASRQYSGTGLGLAISRRLVDLMGGTFTMESQPGKGSTFGFTIPTGPLDGVDMLEDPSEVLVDRTEADRSGMPAADALSGVRVLLAEDGLDNQRLIAAVLRKPGAEVTVVGNGRLAVAAALAEPFDVILMDMQMPEMDGYEASTLLRDKGCSLPIIALTAHAMTEDRERCLSAGCTDYQTKPIDRSALIAAVARYAGVQGAEPDDDAVKRAKQEGKGGEAIVSEYANDPDLAEIIDGFVGGLAGHVESMRQALRDERYTDLRREAHQLKGAGGSYGYPDLTDAARVVEMIARAGDAVSGRVALERLGTLCQAVVRGRRACAALKEAEE